MQDATGESLRRPHARMRSRAAIDLAITIAFFIACFAVEPILDPIFRHGRGLGFVLAMSAYQFTLEGLMPLAIILVRREHLSDYGITNKNIVRSLLFALLLAAGYDLIVSLYAGTTMWVPMRRQPALRMSLAAGFPMSVLGIATIISVWGMIEGLFGVYFSRKLSQALGHSGRGWLAPGVVGFAVFNGIVHVGVRQGLRGFVTSFASGYAIAVISALTGNAWGSALFQALTDAVGGL